MPNINKSTRLSKIPSNNAPIHLCPKNISSSTTPCKALDHMHVSPPSPAACLISNHQTPSHILRRRRAAVIILLRRKAPAELIALLARLLGLLSLSLLVLLLLLEGLFLLAAEMGEAAVWAAENEARVHDVEEDEGEEHGEGVEAEGVAFVAEDGVVAVDAGTEFGEAVDDSNL